MDARGLALALIVVAASGCAAPGQHGRTLEDDLGRSVDVSRIDRLLPTSIDLVEILLALGQRDRILAVPDWIDSEVSCVTAPEGSQGLPQYGRPHVISPEEVVALAPSLVLVKDHPLQGPGLAAQLEQAGLDVFVFDPGENVENLHRTVRTVARILEPEEPDAPARAEQVVAAFDADVDAVTQALAARPQEPILRGIYQHPAGIVSANGTTADLLLRLAGASDAAADLGLSGYKQISPESLARADPERVVASCTAATRANDVFGQPRYASTTAAALGPQTLRVVDPGVAALIGLRFPQGLREVAQWLHPAAFGLAAPDVQVTVEGRTARVDASASTVATGPPTFRVLAGDGSAAVEDEDGRVDVVYGAAGTYTLRVLVIDADGRIHEDRRSVTVT